MLVLGGFAFLYTSAFIVADKEECKSLTQGSAHKYYNTTTYTDSEPKDNFPQNDISLTKLWQKSI